MKVTNMINSRTNCKVANQYIIKDRENHKIYFQSYDTVVACVEYAGRAGEVILVKGACDFSKTTSKYLYKFLDGYTLINPSYNNKKGITELIKRGEIREVESFWK